MNRIDLQAPTLEGPTRINLGAGIPSCTRPRQPTIEVYQFANLIVSQTSLSVNAPPKNTTTVKSQRKNPKKKKSPSETAKQMDPHFLTDPPVAPQHPTIDPITTKIKITHKIVTGAVRAY